MIGLASLLLQRIWMFFFFFSPYDDKYKLEREQPVIWLLPTSDHLSQVMFCQKKSNKKADNCAVEQSLPSDDAQAAVTVQQRSKTPLTHTHTHRHKNTYAHIHCVLLHLEAVRVEEGCNVFVLTSTGAGWGAEAGHHLGSAEASWSPVCKCSWPSPRATAWSTGTSSAAQRRPETGWQRVHQVIYLTFVNFCLYICCTVHFCEKKKKTSDLIIFL